MQWLSLFCTLYAVKLVLYIAFNFGKPMNVKCLSCCKITFAFSLTLCHSSSYFFLTVTLAFTTAASAAVVTIVSSQSEPMSPLRDRPVIFYTYPTPLTHTSGYNEQHYPAVVIIWNNCPSVFNALCIFRSLSLRWISSCLYIAPKPSSVSSKNRESHPGAAQPVQSWEAKEPTAQSQRPHPRYVQFSDALFTCKICINYMYFVLEKLHRYIKKMEILQRTALGSFDHKGAGKTPQH